MGMAGKAGAPPPPPAALSSPTAAAMPIGGSAIGGLPSLGKWSGTSKSFDAQQGCGFIQCPDLQAQGYTSDVILRKDDVGGFEIGAKVSFPAILNAQGQPE